MSGGSTVLVLQSVKNLLVPDLHSCFTLSDLVQVLHQITTRWTRTPDGLHSHSGHVTIQTWYYCSTAGISVSVPSCFQKLPRIPGCRLCGLTLLRGFKPQSDQTVRLHTDHVSSTHCTSGCPDKYCVRSTSQCSTE